MKLRLRYLGILIAIACSIGQRMSAQVHFVPASNTGNNAIVAIPPSAEQDLCGFRLAVGDEIGVFTSAGLCVGATVWTGGSGALAVWGDDPMTLQTDGMLSGEMMVYHVWQRSTNLLYTDIQVTYSRGNGTYIANGVNVISSFVAVPAQGTISGDYEVGKRWNLISLPLLVQDGRKVDVFPSAVSSAFTYSANGSYVRADSLANGVGYWLRFSDQTIHLAGIPLAAETITVHAGWNLVGAPSSPIAVSSILTDPPGMETSNFFGYQGRYVAADTLNPMNGYWVRLGRAGLLIVSSDSVTNPASLIKVVQTSDLPPPPPDEVQADVPAVPQEYTLGQNYPNPFNPATTLQYGLPEDSKVKLQVYNVLGQLVEVLLDGIQQAGYRSIKWNAASVSSGVYFYRLDAVGIADPSKTLSQVRKMLFVK